MTIIEIFERAFSSGGAGCRRTCQCGREFYDWYNTYDWEEGELEALNENPNAEGHDFSIGTLYIEGEEFCECCNCWHGRAEQIMKWLDAHARPIAKYLSLMKEEKQRQADIAPTVKASPRSPTERATDDE